MMSGENGLLTEEEIRALASLCFLEKCVDANSVRREGQLKAMIGLKRKGFVRELLQRPAADIPIYTPKSSEGEDYPKSLPFYLALPEGSRYIGEHWDLIPERLLWGVQKPVA